MIKIRIAFAFVSLLLTSSFSIAQQTLPVDPETKKVTLQETISMDTVTRQELYTRTLDWMTHLFKTNKFDMHDKVNFKLMHEGNFPVSYKYDFKYTSNNTVTYNCSIDLKEGKYRYTFTDFKIYDDKLGPKNAQTLEIYFQKMKTGSKQEFVTNFNKETNAIVEEMKTHLSTGKAEDKDDW